MRNDEAADIEMHIQEVSASVGRLRDALGHKPNLTFSQRVMLFDAADHIELICRKAANRRAA